MTPLVFLQKSTTNVLNGRKKKWTVVLTKFDYLSFMTLLLISYLLTNVPENVD